jgi:putative hemolysin
MLGQWRIIMWKPWQVAAAWTGELARASHAAALDNARVAATDLSRARVVREEVELFLRDAEAERPAAAGRTVRLA